MTAAECTLKQFKAAWFNDDRSVLTDDEFKDIHLEYVDLAGLTKTRELELNAQLYSLQNRVEKVKWLIYGLRLSIESLGKPFSAAISDLNKLGHKLYWDGDDILFMELLKRVETKEKKYIGLLSEKEDELIKFYEAQSKGESGVTQTRQQFIRNEIELRKRGHEVNDSTTVEVFALIVKSENESAEKANFKNGKK